MRMEEVVYTIRVSRGLVATHDGKQMTQSLVAGTGKLLFFRATALRARLLYSPLSCSI